MYNLECNGLVLQVYEEAVEQTLGSESLRTRSAVAVLRRETYRLRCHIVDCALALPGRIESQRWRFIWRLQEDIPVVVVRRCRMIVREESVFEEE
jgi:hypothetical protein